MTSPRLFLVLPLLVSLSGVSCGEGAPRPSEVKDLRVLGMQASPPEIQVDRVSDWEATHTTVTALLVNPEQTPVNYSWRFCPIESDDSCDSLEEALVPWSEDLAMLALGCATLLDTASPVDEERWADILNKIRDLASPRPENSGTAKVFEATMRYDLPHFNISLPKELVMYLCVTDPFGAPVGWRPSVVLEVSNDKKTLIAQKRLNLTLADLTTPKKRDLFMMIFGLQVCSEEVTDDCLPFSSSGSELNSLNQNPTITTVQRSYSDLSTSEFSDLPRRPDSDRFLSVEIEKKLPFRFLPVVPEESQQNYQVLQTDIDQRRLEIRDVQEDISISWFTSDGETRDELTWPKFTKTLDTVYTPPKEDPEERIWLWMVARDQRGGASWAEIPMQFKK